MSEFPRSGRAMPKTVAVGVGFDEGSTLLVTSGVFWEDLENSPMVKAVKVERLHSKASYFRLRHNLNAYQATGDTPVGGRVR